METGSSKRFGKVMAFAGGAAPILGVGALLCLMFAVGTGITLLTPTFFVSDFKMSVAHFVFPIAAWGALVLATLTAFLLAIDSACRKAIRKNAPKARSNA